MFCAAPSSRVVIGIMQTLGALTDEIRREINIQWATKLCDDSIDLRRPRRFLSGICVSSRQRTTNGVGRLAGGVSVALPAPVLWNHLWEQPIGLLTKVEVHGEELHFQAELSNSGTHSWMENAWSSICSRRAACVSVCAINLQPEYLPYMAKWKLAELSVCPQGADP